MAPMSNIVIGIACVLLSACDVYRPTPAERVRVVEVSQGDEVKSTIVPLHTVVHRRLTNAWSGSTASKLTAKDEVDRLQEAQSAQETFRYGAPVSPREEKAEASVPAARSGATGSKLTPIKAAQETFRGGFPVSSGDEVKAGGASVPAADTGATPKLIDINTASAEDLNRLGERLGKAIIAGRPYRSLDELVSKRVPKRSTFCRIKERITVNTAVQPPAAPTASVMRSLEVKPGRASVPAAMLTATGSKLTPIEAAQEAFRGHPVSPGDEVKAGAASVPAASSGATGSKLTPIEAAQEPFRGHPVSPGDEVKDGAASAPAASSGGTGSKLTPIGAAQEAFRGPRVSTGDEVKAGAASVSAARSAATPKLMDINTASAGDLDQLGERFGKAIVAGRPYRSVDELVSKRVLKRSTFSRIKARITATHAQSGRASPRPSASNTPPDPSSRKSAAPVVQPVATEPVVSTAFEPELIDINTASAEDLKRLGERLGKAIIAGRPYRSVDDLVSKRVLKRSDFSRIKDRITIKTGAQPSEGVKALRVRG